MKNLLTQSKDMSHEYCCTVVQIGDIKPVEGSDFLAVTSVEGRDIVVRKDQVKEGDIMFYASNECQLNQDFLSVNNLFEDKTMNMNTEVKGYFNKYGRVRMIKLRGVLSMGFIFSIEDMKRWCPSFELDAQVGEDFDTVNGELFVKAYVPPVKEVRHSGTGNKRNKTLKKFDRMIPGEFSFHYDTQQLQRNMGRLKPEDTVVVSTKIHGTSFICGNVLVKKPVFGGLYNKIFNYLPKFLQFTKQDYDVVYSSRTVIKNKNINSGASEGYYSQDVWGDYYKLLKDFIPQGYTIYGEIVGYLTDSNSMIQKGYDYGCKPGENKLMIYRATKKVNGETKELNIDDVINLTNYITDIMDGSGLHEESKKIMPYPMLYHGTLKDLYNIDTANHWHENVLEFLKNEKRFLMEENEPLCRNKVPREGICLRIDDDVIPECFKLKCLNFLQREAKEVDAGQTDIETEQRY